MYDLVVLEAWNIAAFDVLRAAPGLAGPLALLGIWLAEAPAYAAGAIMLYYLVRHRDAGCAAALAVALVSARLVKAAVGFYAYHPRPFAAGFGPALIEHASSNSLPSSHATFIWVMAVVCAARGRRRLAAVLFLLGCVQAWSRVFVGVHWPLDMLAAAIVAVACGLFGNGLQRAGARLCKRT